MARKSRVAWSKVLYERQPFPDNYVDSKKFLEEMRKNVNTQLYTFWQISVAACVISHQLSSVIIFIVAFCYMHLGWLHPTSVLAGTLPVAVVGYFAHRFLAGGSTWSDYVDDLKSTGLVVAYSYGLSPVLRTLTQSVSTDTIYTMTLVMILAHLYVHDYGTGSGVAVVSPPLSMNAAVFAAVCLASRLPSPWHTFAMLTCAMALLVFLPLLRRRIVEHFAYSQVLLAVPFFAAAVCALSTLTAVGTAGFVLLQAVVVIGCPHIYCQMQNFKNNIHGPWDEALPDTNAAPLTPEERVPAFDEALNGTVLAGSLDAVLAFHPR